MSPINPHRVAANRGATVHGLWPNAIVENFHELPAGGIYTDGVPANPVLVNSWVRSGHPLDETTRLATAIAAAVSRIANVDPDRVMMVIQNSPASGAVEGGRVLPEPGQEQEWLAGA